MQVTIDVREDFLHDVNEAAGDDGSNDAEHELLQEIAGTIGHALPKRTFVVEQTEQFRVLAHSPEDAIETITNENAVGENVDWLACTERRVIG